jgi:hypothetical protein
MKLSVEELNAIHGALVTRERVIREDWIPAWGEDTKRAEELRKEADLINALRSRVCNAKIEAELGVLLG